MADDVIDFHPTHFTYLRLEVKDCGMDVGMGRVFKQGLDFVTNATGGVLIHCRMGINRLERVFQDVSTTEKLKKFVTFGTFSIEILRRKGNTDGLLNEH